MYNSVSDPMQIVQLISRVCMATYCDTCKMSDKRDRQTKLDRRTNRQPNRQTDKQTERRTNGQTDRQTNRKTDKQTDRQTNK